MTAREYYLTRPRRADIQQWESSNRVPDCVHDVFWNPEAGAWAGYVNTLTGEKIVHVGQYIVTWHDTADHEIVEYPEIMDRFVKIVE